MPSIAAHMVIAKNVSNLLNIKEDDFVFGNILPDIIDLDPSESHFKIKGKKYLIPDIEKYKSINKYPKYIYLGYLSHLLLDKYFLEEYMIDNINSDKNLFLTGDIYLDYDSINYSLVKHYNLDIKYINEILNNKSYNLDKDKLNKNISCINLNTSSNPKYIDLNTFILFLDNISIRIANIIKEELS